MTGTIVASRELECTGETLADIKIELYDFRRAVSDGPDSMPDLTDNGVVIGMVGIVEPFVRGHLKGEGMQTAAGR